MSLTEIPWIRTYPVGTPDDLASLGRRFVWDQSIDQVSMDTDYRPVLAQLDTSTILTEWDIAFDPVAASMFEQRCLDNSEHVQVVPYRLWPASTGLAETVIAHRRAVAYDQYRWVTYRDLECDLFGFGMVYLPLQTIRDYLSANPGIATDDTFSRWHFHSGRGPVRIHWGVQVIHLHY